MERNDTAAERGDNSVAQQDALSNAFLALFGILVLILIQVGFEHVDARALDRVYARPPSSLEATDAGPTPIALTPSVTVITVLTPSPDVDVVPVKPDGAAVSPAIPLLPPVPRREGLWGSQKGFLFQVQLDQVPRSPDGTLAADFEAALQVVHKGPATASPVFVWFDDGLLGEPGKPLQLSRDEPLTLWICGDESARAFRGSEGGCG